MTKFRKYIYIMGIAAAVAIAPGTNAYAQQPGQENTQPAAEQPAAEQPAAEQPAAEQPAAEQPAAEQPAAQQPAAEQPAAQQPAAEQPAAEQPAAQQTQKTTKKSSTNNQKKTEETKKEEEEEKPSATEGLTEGKYKLSFIKNANLRSEASKSSSSLVVVPLGIKLEATAKAVNAQGETWYRLTYAGTEGYVREDMVNVEAIPEVEVVEEEPREEAVEETVEEAEGEAQEAEAVTEEAATEQGTQPSYNPAFTRTREQEIKLEEDVKVQDLTTQENDTNKNRRIDGYMLFFIFAGVFGLAMALYIFIMIRVKYLRGRTFMIKRLMREDHNISVQNNT